MMMTMAPINQIRLFIRGPQRLSFVRGFNVAGADQFLSGATPLGRKDPQPRALGPYSAALRSGGIQPAGTIMERFRAAGVGRPEAKNSPERYVPC